METIGLRELNHNLSAAVTRVAAGARLVITDRGRAVADLTPHVREPIPGVRARMIADGSLRPARRKDRRLPALRPGLADRPNSRDLLAAEREKERRR